MVHQYLATIGDTYWVQSQVSPTPTSGTVVTINDTAPAGDRYNLSIVEVLPLAGSGGSTFNISGSITPSASGSGATVTLTQGGTTIATVTANSSGNYSFPNVANGTYTVTPSKTGFTFSPASQQVTVNGANVTAPNFTAQGTQSSQLYPDLSVIIPTTGTKAMTIVGTGSTREFRYTHDTFNEGPGPLVIQPAFNSASGNYLGTQYIYTYNSPGGWSITSEIPVAGAFIFHAAHGHFHFPLVTFGLYDTSGPGGGPGNPIIFSEKDGFCINDSFIYDPSIPHAGETGTFGSCSDPTTLRGLHIGAVDEYDLNDPGQSISIPNLPNGTYWFKALADPENYLAESDKTNNETDVELTINGNTVQVLRTVTPVLNPPPAITLTSPLSGIFVSGNVTLSASPVTTSGVQYLLDGLPFGPIVSAGPSYNLSWNTTTVPDGVHWLAAQTTDSTGIIGTSSVSVVTVNNATSSVPIVQLADPTNGSVLSAIVTLNATVASSQPIASVAFFVDNGTVPVGTVTTSPYMIPWNTATVGDGSHVITVRATDSLGNVGNSAPVTVTVNNSNPAKTITKDIPPVSVDGQGIMTTPSFSTPTANDLLIAFLSYDGPSNSAQTGNVTGAGLTWTLLERSNTQAGTSEIWSARANGTLSNVTVSSQPGNGSGYHGSLTVIAFTNAAGTSVVGRAGAPSGEPDIYVPGVIAGDWVFAVGNDWDRAIARTPVSGQELVHQRIDTAVGDTFWVQSTTAPSTANGLVDIHDTQPTNDRWNYAVVEIVATH
ncbi:MAG: Ig-like domain-containing protein [Methylomicrobium sp.]